MRSWLRPLGSALVALAVSACSGESTTLDQPSVPAEDAAADSAPEAQTGDSSDLPDTSDPPDAFDGGADVAIDAALDGELPDSTPPDSALPDGTTTDAPGDAPQPDGSALAPVGAACADSTACKGALCLTEAMGFPDGYCSQLSCDPAAPGTSCLAAGGDGMCLEVGQPAVALCFDRCDPQATDCRPEYVCRTIAPSVSICVPAPVCGNGTVEVGEECEPPGTSTCDSQCLGLGALPVGDPCGTAADCAGNYCITEWPDGYCTLSGCDLATPDVSCAAAGGDGFCWDMGQSGAPFGACLDRCQPGGTDCRVGYQCAPAGGGMGLCVPTPVCGNGTVETGEECEPPNTPTCDTHCQGLGTLPVGDACVSPTDCAGNYCITEWADGYCTQYGCDLANPDSSCQSAGGDGICVDVGDNSTPVGACLDVCDPTDPDCRSGYTCQGFPGSVALCLPTPECGNGVVEMGEECEPPSTATCDSTCQGLGTLAVGQACEGADECAGSLCLADWPAGYCSDVGCNLASPTTSCSSAGGDGLCIDVGEAGSPLGICLDRCAPLTPDCRTGYDCVRISLTNGLCLPTPVCGNGVVERGEECEPPGTASCNAQCQGPGTAATGVPCSSPTECVGNLCLPDAGGWSGGYCSQLDCDPFSASSCDAFGPDAVCGVLDLLGSATVICLDGCNNANQCRTGYQCQWVGIGGNACVPQ